MQHSHFTCNENQVTAKKKKLENYLCFDRKGLPNDNKMLI